MKHLKFTDENGKTTMLSSDRDVSYEQLMCLAPKTKTKTKVKLFFDFVNHSFEPKDLCLNDDLTDITNDAVMSYDVLHVSVKGTTLECTQFIKRLNKKRIMKLIESVFGKETEIMVNAKEVQEFDNARGNANSGMPTSDFCIMPLLGRTQYNIEGSKPVTTVCAVYKDKTGKHAFRMISANSFGRTAKETPESPIADVKLIENLTDENLFTLKPSEVIALAKGRVFSIKETKTLYFPKFNDGVIDWENPTAKATAMREVEENDKEYKEARKAFDLFVKENKLEAAVKAIEA